SFARERLERALDQPRLVELLRLLDEDLTREVWMIQLVDVQRTNAVMRDIAELACDVQSEGERIERKHARQHLSDDGERQVDARTRRPLHGRPQNRNGTNRFVRRM